MANPRITVITPTIRPEGLKPNQESLERQTFKDFEWLVEVGIPGGGHDLNRAFNRMLKRAKGELIVIMEDWTKCLPTGLENFWNAYQEDNKTFFTAPLGKTLDWKEIKWDWRAYKDAKMHWNTWEIDWGAAPQDALFEIGGFDEELDMYWSSDNVNVGCRADLAGYKFKNLIDNPAMAYDHDAVTEHPFRKDFNPDFNNQRMTAFRDGLKINYLK